MRTVTVAIPTLNGGAVLERTLAAVDRQQLADATVELLVCDSGSTDGSVEVARAHGAELIEIAPEHFSHGGTRNLMMERAQGEHVAFLTQDAQPAGDSWLARLLEGFSVADDVGLVFGPYLPRADASAMVARELSEWFRGFSPDGGERIDRLDEADRGLPVRELLGPGGFFTDANGCVLRVAWQQVPFRAVAYAEDHVLAHDMMRAGFAKVFVPDAAVIHSHEYSGWGWLRRSFDEARAMHDVYGFDEPGELKRAALNVWGSVGADLRFAGASGRHSRGPVASTLLAARSLHHHAMRAAGTMLGVRARRIPGSVVQRLSLERRG